MGGVEDGDWDNRGTLAGSEDESAGFEALEGTVPAPGPFGEKYDGAFSVEHLHTGV